MIWDKDGFETEWKRIENERIRLRETDMQLGIDIMNYRLESVLRVISFVKDNYKKLSEEQIDEHLTHCLNKGYGYIDGVELDLSIDKEEVIDKNESRN